MSEMPASVQQAIDIVEDECFLNDFSPVEKTKSRKILWRVGNIIRDRIKASAAARCSADSAQPVAWTNQSQLGFLKDEALATIPMAMWAKRGNAADVPLYAKPARAEPQTAPSQKEIDKTLCCPGGCVRSDDCFVDGPWERWARTAHERKQSEAVQALFNRYRCQAASLPQTAQPGPPAWPYSTANARANNIIWRLCKGVSPQQIYDALDADGLAITEKPAAAQSQAESAE